MSSVFGPMPNRMVCPSHQRVARAWARAYIFQNALAVNGGWHYLPEGLCNSAQDERRGHAGRNAHPEAQLTHPARWRCSRGTTSRLNPGRRMPLCNAAAIVRPTTTRPLPPHCPLSPASVGTINESARRLGPYRSKARAKRLVPTAKHRANLPNPGLVRCDCAKTGPKSRARLNPARASPHPPGGRAASMNLTSTSHAAPRACTSSGLPGWRAVRSAVDTARNTQTLRAAREGRGAV